MVECRLSFCTRPAKYKVKMLCASHYMQERDGRPFTDLTRPKPGLCVFENCGRKISAERLCASHLYQRKTGKELRPIREVRSVEEIRYRDERGRKFCLAGRHWQPEPEFHRLSSASDGLQPKCKVCVRETQKARKDLSLCWKYGITPQALEGMRSSQRGKCAICTESYGPGNVDHDHACCPGNRSCGRCVRALLCRSCNQALGLIRESIPTLRNLIEYLDESKDSLHSQLCLLREAHLLTYPEQPRTPDSPRKVRDRILRKKYQLNTVIVQEIIRLQGNKCRGCGASGGGVSWHVDHNHQCCSSKYTCGGCIRGVLCQACNQSLGLFRDSPKLLQSVIDYIETSNIRRVDIE